MQKFSSPIFRPPPAAAPQGPVLLAGKLGGITTLDEIRNLQKQNIHAALGIAIYSGRLSLDDLAKLKPGDT